MSERGLPFRVVVFCEAAADKQTACALADRVLLAARDGTEPSELDACRRYTGLVERFEFVAWRHVRKLAAAVRSGVHGHMSGSPIEADARMARRALRLIQLEHGDVGAVLLIRDSDGRPERRVGLEQARSSDAWSLAVVIGLAEAKREAWLISAFEPSHGRHRKSLADLRKHLGFDPRTNSHDLTAQQDNAKRSAKRVWAELSPDGDEDCIDATPLETLRERGRGNGLAAYLDEVESRLVPIILGG